MQKKNQRTEIPLMKTDKTRTKKKQHTYLNQHKRLYMYIYVCMRRTLAAESIFVCFCLTVSDFMLIVFRKRNRKSIHTSNARFTKQQVERCATDNRMIKIGTWYDIKASFWWIFHAIGAIISHSPNRLYHALRSSHTAHALRFQQTQ